MSSNNSNYDSSAPPGFWPPSATSSRSQNPNEPPSKDEVEIEVKRRLARKAEFLASGRTKYHPLQQEVDWVRRGLKHEANVTNLYFAGASAATFAAASFARYKYPAFNAIGLRAFISIFGGLMGASIGYKKAQDHVLNDLLSMKESPIGQQTYEWFRQVQPSNPMILDHRRDLSAIFNRNEYLSQLPNPVIYPHTIFETDLPNNVYSTVQNPKASTTIDPNTSVREGVLFQRDDSVLMTESIDDQLDDRRRSGSEYYNVSGKSPSGIDEWRRNPIYPDPLRTSTTRSRRVASPNNNNNNNEEEYATTSDAMFSKEPSLSEGDRYIKL